MAILQLNTLSDSKTAKFLIPKTYDKQPHPFHTCMRVPQGFFQGSGIIWPLDLTVCFYKFDK